MQYFPRVKEIISFLSVPLDINILKNLPSYVFYEAKKICLC